VSAARTTGIDIDNEAAKTFHSNEQQKLTIFVHSTLFGEIGGILFFSVPQITSYESLKSEPHDIMIFSSLVITIFFEKSFVITV